MKDSRKWQVGLEIQPNNLCIVACQYHKRAWRLQLVESLPFHQKWSWENDSPSLDEWLPLLKKLRNQLPKNYSLRISLPPDLVFSHELKLPNKLTDKAVLYDYIQAAISQLFPNTIQTLMADYCVIASKNPCVQLTLVRKTTVLLITQLFGLVNLRLDVIDLLPCALLPLFQRAGLGQDSILIYQSALFWCFAYHDQQGLNSGWAHRASYDNSAACCQGFMRANNIKQCFISATNQEIPSGFTWFNPIEAIFINGADFKRVEECSKYFVACGLALREEDRLCNR